MLLVNGAARAMLMPGLVEADTPGSEALLGARLLEAIANTSPDALPRLLAGETVAGLDLPLGLPWQDAELTIGASGVPLLDDRGRVTAILLNFADITPERGPLPGLPSSRQRLRTLVDAIDSAILVFAPDGSVLHANRGGKLLLEQNLHLLASSDTSAASADGTDRGESTLESPLSRALRLATPQRDLLLPYVREDGEPGWLQASFVPLLDPAGGVSQVVATGVDVTHSKTAEAALARQHAYLAALHETTLALMRRQDLHGLLETIVCRAMELLGAPLGVVHLLEPAERWLDRVVAIGPAGPAITRQHRGEGLAGQVWAQGRSLVVPDYTSWEHRLPELEHTFALAGVPLYAGNRFLGVLSVGGQADRSPFDAQELALLERFGQLAALALDSARSHAEAQEALQSRLAAEAELRRGEARFRAIFELAAIGVVYTDLAGRISESNGLLDRLLGLSGDEVVGRDFHDLIVEAERAAFQRHFAALATEGGDYRRIEVRLSRPGGEPVWSACTISLVRAVDGAPRFFIVLVEDVDQRKQAEETLRQHNAYLGALHRTTLDLLQGLNLDKLLPAIVERAAALLGLTDGFLAIEDPGRAALTVRAACGGLREMVGYSVAPGQGVSGKVWLAGWPIVVDDYEQLSDRVADLPSRLYATVGVPIESGQRAIGALVLANLSPERRFSEDEVELLGHFARFASLALDNARLLAEAQQELAERMRAEEALRLRDRAIDAASNGIVITDAEPPFQIISVNRAFERITGYRANELLGCEAFFLGDRGAEPRAVEDLMAVLAEGRPFTSTLRCWRKDGSPFWNELSISPVHDEVGQLVHFIGVMSDISQRRRAEDELRQAQKLESVGRLAAGIAHEINTPIQFVGDNVQFLRESFVELTGLLERYRAFREGLGAAPVDPASLAALVEAEQAIDLDYLVEEIPRAIDQTMDGVVRVATIVRAMKDFAHPDKGREKVPADVNLGLERTLTVARNELKYVATVVTDFGDLPSVPCRPGDLNQVFLNLLVNAAHAIADAGKNQEAPGRIRVSTRVDGDSVLVAIADDGCGIRPEIRDKIFDQFFTTKAVGRGTGQGLSLARSIVVDQHGGDLWFESEAGRGTTFYVRLPLHSTELVPREAA